MGEKTQYSPLVKIAKISSNDSISKNLIYLEVKKKLNGLVDALKKAKEEINILIKAYGTNFMKNAEELLEEYVNKINENIVLHEEIILLLCNDGEKLDSYGIEEVKKGMSDKDIELNLKLLKYNIESKNNQSLFYTEEKVLNKNNILDKVMSWHDSNNEQKHFLSIVTVINNIGKKHALALHIEKVYDTFKVYIIDPLSCDKSEFKQEISDLQNILSILPGVSYQMYTGEQDINSATCGDISLFELFKILNNKVGNFQRLDDKIFSDTAVVINNKIDYLFNEKLRAQTEFYLETGIVFETFKNAVENNQITILTTYNQDGNSN